MTVSLAGEAETRRLAGCLARSLGRIALTEQGVAVHLSGDLGAGKTTLARHLLASLGIGGPVKSPSYALLESYNGPSFMVYHFDLYRFSSPEQWIDAGFDEIVAGPGLVLIEWPEQAEGVLPAPDLRLRLDFVAEDSSAAGSADAAARIVAITAHSATGRQCLSALDRCWSEGATG